MRTVSSWRLLPPMLNELKTGLWPLLCSNNRTLDFCLDQIESIKVIKSKEYLAEVLLSNLYTVSQFMEHKAHLLLYKHAKEYSFYVLSVV